MKKALFCILVIYILTLLCACSVSFPAKKPSDGIFYCSELKMSIDFSLLESTPECIKLYTEDGNYTVCRCMIDYGCGIGICSADQETYYLTGCFSYEGDNFTIETYADNTVYTFVRQPETGTV